MRKILPLLALILVSASIIFFKFNQIPKNLTNDEVEFAKLALSLKDKPYTPYSTMATGHSTLYFYVMLVSFELFGVNNFALRLPAAVFGVLSVAMFYLLMTQVFKKSGLTAFLASLILMTSRWFFGFARFSFEATFLILLEIISLYFLTVSARSKVALIFSGFFAGLAFISYTPGRFFFLIPLLYIIVSSLKNRQTLIKNVLFYAVPFLITIAPLTSYLMTHRDSRVDNLFFWKNNEMTVSEKIDGTMQNVVSIGSMFVYKGDVSGKHNYPGKPAINPIVDILLITGLILAVKNLKERTNLMFLSYFFMSLIPSLMIYPWENPNMLRTITAVPAVAYFSGLTIITTINSFHGLKHKFLNKLGVIIVILLILLSAIYEMRTYFIFQARVFPSAFETRPSLPETLKHTNFKYK